MSMIWEQALLVKSIDGADFVRELSRQLLAVLRVEAARLIESALEEEVERWLMSSLSQLSTALAAAQSSLGVP